MSDILGALVTAQFLGYMMKTGGCPQPADVKNMVKAAESAVVPMLEAEARVEVAHRQHDKTVKEARQTRLLARYKVTEDCMEKHKPHLLEPAKQFKPHHEDGCLSVEVCSVCCEFIEGMP